VLRPLDDTVRQARQVIREHYREPMLPDDLAAVVHVSGRQLSRLFTTAMGKTPLVYRDSLRVQHMIRLLVATTTPVAVIARDLGWTKEDNASPCLRRLSG
jgi:transcriptional regulator GlxA family with amidase domain